jgi:hypothetical protein
MGKHRQEDCARLARHKARPYFKNNAKRAGRVAQVVELPPSKHEALNSNHQKKKKGPLSITVQMIASFKSRC